MNRSTVELLAQATRTAGTAAGPAAILALVDTLLPFTSCLVTLLAADRQPVVLYDDIRPERREAVIGAYLRGAYLLDPFYDLVVRGFDRPVVRLTKIQPDHFRKSEYFSTYYTDTRLARRENEHIGVYVSDEQRSQPGCSAARMQPEFRHGLLDHRRRRGTRGGSPRTDVAHWWPCRN